MAQSILYEDIIGAIEAATRCGRFAEQHKGNEFISQREALKLYGSRLVREYYQRHGHADRTGGAANSKKMLSTIKLNEMKEAKTIQQGIVRFECKIIERQRKLQNQ